MGVSLDAGGGKSKVKPSMNITPLVDVVLVLLIIFMVVTPLMMKQFWVHVPKKAEETKAPPPSKDNPPVVLSVGKDGVLKINRDVIKKEALPEKLKRVFAAKQDHTLFFKADDEAPYGIAVEALDIARSGGAVTIAVITDNK